MNSPLWLSDDPTLFPPVETAQTEPNGLLAIGGDLSVQRLITAYSQGIFPWYNEDQPILWWSPDPRTILHFDDFHVSKSMLKLLKKDYDVFLDRNFEAVITQCQQPRAYEKETWISNDMKSAYLELFKAGLAHCIEVEHQGTLLGGLYGVSLGKVFFGESMFSAQANGSKLALHFLIEHLKSWNFTWLDCQVWSEHLASLGCKTIPRKDFIQLLNTALTKPNHQGPWS